MIILLDLIVLLGNEVGVARHVQIQCSRKFHSWSSSFNLIGRVTGLHVDLYVVLSNR